MVQVKLANQNLFSPINLYYTFPWQPKFQGALHARAHGE